MEKHSIALTVAVLAVYCSCSPTPRGGHVDDAKFARVYAQLTKHGFSFPAVRADTTVARAFADSILAHEGVSREGMLEAVKRLNEDPAHWSKVYDLVEKEMIAQKPVQSPKE
jgi:hypothetical protein